MQSINKICEQCKKSHDDVKGRANNLTMCDSCENNRLRAQRHSRRSKDLTVDAVDELTKAAQPGPTEDDGHEVNDSSIAHGTALVPEEPAISERHCIADCQALKCVALPPDELGVWPCPDCRHLAREVKSAKEDIQKLVTAINDLKNVLRIQSEHYQTEKLNQNMTITSIEKDNATLLTKNSELEDRLRGSSRNSQESSNESASKTLIIGTSLLRNLDEGKLDQSEVRSLSGAKMRDIATELEAMASDGLHYGRVVILAGGNDAAQPVESLDLESTMTAFNDAVVAAKKLSNDVAVTEIPPRFKPPHAKDNISALNANIVAAASELSIEYVSNQNYFLLQSNDIMMGTFMTMYI